MFTARPVRTARPVLAPPLVAVVLALVALAACGGPASSGEALAVQLRDAPDRWERAAITDYAYEVRGACECNLGGHLEVTVEDGRVVDVVRLDVPGRASIGAEVGATTEDLFALIDEAIGSSDAVEALFDSIDGHPLEIRITWVADAADGGLEAHFDFEPR